MATLKIETGSDGKVWVSLTLNLPHPLIKQVDDELVLRGMSLRRDAEIVRAVFAELF